MEEQLQRTYLHYLLFQEVDKKLGSRIFIIMLNISFGRAKQ
jgi:hypothetical protein